MKDKVSIIIPTYNGSATLQPTLESVLQQEYKNYEVIVVDDGSTDSTLDIVKSLMPSARIIQQRNRGTMAARQAGIDIADGDLIALLDQDDLWFKETLLIGVNFLKEHPEVQLVVGNMQAVDEKGVSLGFDVVPNPTSYSLVWENLLLIQPIATSTTLFRKGVLETIGPLDADFGFSGALGDLDFFVRVSEAAKAHFINRNLGLYRWSETRPGRLISFLDNLQIYARKYSWHPRLLDGNNPELRIKFALACCNYAIHIYRLLLNQYDYKIPAELLSKLNKHNETMGSLFGGIYGTHIRLRSLDFDLLNVQQESQRTLLFLYLLRRDLQEVFPEVIQGDLDKLLEWASAVIQRQHADGDFEVLNSFASELNRKESISLKQRWKFSRLSRARNVQKIRFLLSSRLQTILPLRSRRRRLIHPLIAGVRTIVDDGWKSFFRKSYVYLAIRLRSLATRWVDRLAKTRQEIRLAQNFKKKISFPIYASPQVAVIVKVGRNKRKAYRCLANLLFHSQIPYKVFILFDDTEATINNYVGSINNVVKKVLSKDIKSDVDTYRLLGSELSSEKYVLFLSDDIIVTEQYLDPMISMIENNIQYGVITCKVVERSSKKLLYAGIMRQPDGKFSYRGFGDEPDKPEYSYVRSVALGFPNFYLIRRGILDELLANNQPLLETARFFQSIQEQGYKIQYQPKSTVLWNALEAPKLTADHNLHMSGQFRDYLAPENSGNTTTTILVIDDYIPAIRYGSGFPRLYEMLICLAELGYSVTFFPVGNPIKVQPETENLQQNGIEVFWDHFADLQQFIQDRSGYYDAVLISRPHIFEAFVSRIQWYFPHAAILYDAEAIFYTRELLKAQIMGVKTDEAKKSRMARAEMRLIEMADLVISVSQKDKEIMMEESSQKNIGVWGHVQDIDVSSTSFEQRSNILFLGSFFAGVGSPNEDAALFFAREIFPKIQEKLDCTLYIVGGSPTPAVKKLACDEIKVTGYVENLEKYFDSCKVNVVPTRFAAGIPLKLLQAMGHGLPSVVTPIIADQLNLSDSHHVLVAGTPNEFAEKVVRLYSEQELWNTMHHNSLEYVENNFSRSIMREKLANLISQGLKLRETRLRDYADRVTDLDSQ